MPCGEQPGPHCNDVMMSTMASQITSLTVVYSTVYSRRRSKKTSKLCVIGLCEGNSPGTGEFPAQRASNAENVSILWRHHELELSLHGYAHHHVVSSNRYKKVDSSQWLMYFNKKLGHEKNTMSSYFSSQCIPHFSSHQTLWFKVLPSWILPTRGGGY